MEDDEDAPSSFERSPSPSLSLSPSPSPSPPPPPISVVHPSSPHPPSSDHPSNSVTVAAPAPLHQTLTLALPIQPPLGAIAGGREDCWSEGATSALIDAWGEHFLELSRGNLKQKHWQEVADVVSSREDYTKPPRTDVQCKNRIDTLKKKYKTEKAKIAAAGGQSGSSSWPFFNRLDILLGPIIKTPPPSSAKHPSPAAVATAARSQFPQKQRTSLPMKRKPSSSPLPPPPPTYDSSTSDSLPPAPNGRRKRMGAEGMRELTQAILRFGEVYQRVESSKLQQAMEMEKQRMGFAREFEMQRMQFFVKTQMELSQLKRHRSAAAAAAVGGGGGASGGVGTNNIIHLSRQRHHQSPRNGNDNAISE